jgi:hypothetical protein
MENSWRESHLIRRAELVYLSGKMQLVQFWGSAGNGCSRFRIAVLVTDIFVPG